MAMNGNTLGNEIKVAIDAYVDTLSDDDKRNMQDSHRLEIYKAMANAIVTHIVSNAVVNNTGTANGVTLGGSNAPVISVGGIS